MHHQNNSSLSVKEQERRDFANQGEEDHTGGDELGGESCGGVGRHDGIVERC